MNNDNIIAAPNTPNSPQIKICGLTTPRQAIQCARLGADAIGIVMYDKSPRNVSLKQAAKIAQAINGLATPIAVTVDMDIDELLKAAMLTAISTFQLHGSETNDYIARLQNAGLRIIKHIGTQDHTFLAPSSNENPSEPKQPAAAPAIAAVNLPASPPPPQANALLALANAYNCPAFLVECTKGTLPGGNGVAWNWAMAKSLAEKYPFILAGGLSVENIEAAIKQASPDAVDASSSLESSPGIKDMQLVEKFIDKIKQTNLERNLRKIF